MRHIEVNQLWVQEKVAEGAIELHKIQGEMNLADSLTKHVGREIIDMHMDGTNQISGGRHRIMPMIAEVEECCKLVES